MNFNKFTVKAQEAVQAALDMAANRNHQAVEPEHMLRALLSDPDSVAVTLLKKLGVQQQKLEMETDRLLSRLPVVSGSSVGGQYLSNTMKDVFDKAQKLATKMGDEYISSEHVLLALTDSSSEVAKAIKAQGVSNDSLTKAIKEIRGNQRNLRETNKRNPRKSSKPTGNHQPEMNNEQFAIEISSTLKLFHHKSGECSQ